jgi:flagellar biosynthesis protein FlhA
VRKSTLDSRLTYAFSAIVLAIVAILVVPLPPVLLDLLLGINILGSSLVLLISLRVEEPLEFSAFPPALLLATLFRLALDVSATRLILTQGHLVGGVGSVIPAFGAFVVRGNIVVGLIIFAILITIQFIVIATGAQRVAEVCARFTLDAMPGKQMAIDADVHAGLLDAEGARAKRARVQREADFYAAMDGAGKFVKGDAIAALVIVVLNLIGGIVVGMAYHGLSPLDAIDTFALLSIGNALVTTLPAFLISTAMGMMVTRVAGEGALGVDLAMQLIGRPDVLRSAAALMLLLGFVPALPGPLFFGLGAAALGVAQLAHKRNASATAQLLADRERSRKNSARRPEMALALVGVDAIAIDFGIELYPLLNAPNADALLDRIGDVRRALAAEIGLVVPGVRLRDDGMRDPHTYAIRVRDEVVAEGTVRLDALLAVGDTPTLARLEGEPTREPVYGLSAKWISFAAREGATRAGALTFDAISIIGSHLSESVRRHAASLLGRQEFHTLVEHLRATVPSLVKDLGSDLLPIATAHRAFVSLLREGAWPRDPIAVFEAMLDAAATTRDARELAEAARRSIVPQQFRREGVRTIAPLIFDPVFEAELARMWSPVGGLAPDPATALHVRGRVADYLAQPLDVPHTIVCTAVLRPMLSDFFEKTGLSIAVYAYNELPAHMELRAAGVIGLALADVSVNVKQSDKELQLGATHAEGR